MIPLSTHGASGWRLPAGVPLLALLLVAGCGRLGYEPQVRAGDGAAGPDGPQPDSDAGRVDAGPDTPGDAGADLPEADAGRDAAPVDGRPPDAPVDALGPDAAPVDALDPDAAPSDVAPPDLAVDTAPPPIADRWCRQGLPGTVALYTYENALMGGFLSGPLRDLVGGHDGALMGQVAPTAGAAAACGQAGAAPTNQDYAVVPNGPHWNLPQGSIDLWVRAGPATGRRRGILGRDSASTGTTGHLSLLLGYGNWLVVRIQGLAPDAPDRVLLCSEGQLPADRWVHVAVNFGPPGAELYVDGQRSTRTLPVPVGEGIISPDNECGTAGTLGLGPNPNNLVLGASNYQVPDGSPTSNNILVGGAVDHIRISAVRRDFSRW